MIRSMTGYGRGEASRGSRRFAVEIKSVNSRFLEPGFKLPQGLWAREAEARQMIAKRVSRGKLDVFIRDLSEGEQQEARVGVDAALAKAYLAALKDLKRALKSKEGIRLEQVARYPGVIRQEDQAGDAPAAPADDAEAWACLSEAMAAALDSHDASRAREGAALALELEERLAESLRLLAAIEARNSVLLPALRERQRQRLSEALDRLALDDPRLVMEAALLADKADIREELVRFRAHVAEFRRLLAEGGAVGKRLDFLCQELQREANTTGSKNPDAALSHLVVELKGQVEKVKEQVQNLE
jgi:uncharacterized protein (TIGR00255 family)